MQSVPVPSRIRSRADWLIAKVSLMTLGFSIICGLALWQMRSAHYDLAVQASDNLAMSLEADFARQVELYDLSLLAVAEGLSLPEIEHLPVSIRARILFDNSASAQHLGPIRVLSQSGRQIMSSRADDEGAPSAETQEYFQIHQNRSDAGLFFSGPMRDQNGDMAIMVSRRLSTAGGHFMGVVAGSIKLSYFKDLFSRANLGAQGTLALFQHDGRLVMRKPYDEASIGKLLNTAIFPALLTQQRSGTFTVASALDGVSRLHVWRASKYPFVIAVGQSLDAIYGEWRRVASLIVLVMLFMIALVAALTRGHIRELKRRAEVEGELARLAVCDSLTGLANRRGFEERLALERDRARRENRSLSLLMIDADHFKSFNDSFGHQAGDAALVQLARTIQSVVGTTLNLAARYGGEEFIVLLPGLPLPAATAVAERIREQIAKQPVHKRRVTVSIGVASANPAGAAATDIIADADSALYEAKRAGRDTIRPARRILNFARVAS